jgi:hypothetical protein
MDPGKETTSDVGQVMRALTNGIRSDAEIAETASLPLLRVHIALVSLIGQRCVVGSPAKRFRLTDNGNDIVKLVDAAERERLRTYHLS